MSGSAKTQYDAVVVGAGPNGLASAITLCQAGLSVLLVDRGDAPGGGMRSSALTLPGFVHDDCSAVHPLGIASPFFRTLGLERYGLAWIDSPAPLAHILPDGSAVLLERSLDATAEQFGIDEPAYRRLMQPFVRQFETLLPMILAPLRFPAHPLLMLRFGLLAIQSMTGLARARFRGSRPAALLSGIAAHAMVPLDSLVTASFALVLGSAGHAVGWPIARGGSQSIANALVAHYQSLGGELLLRHNVMRLDELPSARAYLLDVSPKSLLDVAGDLLSSRYKERVRRFRYGPGVFKVDWALQGPIPWKDPACGRAVTVHLSGNMGDVAAAEEVVHRGRMAEHPFVLLGQPSIVDTSRAPEGKHTAWAYCHVPHGGTVDALGAIENEVERAAPGFRDVVLARRTRNAAQMEAYDPNYVGGDINGGISDLRQLFFRPMLKADPYETSTSNVFLCSSSTPPGGGVHGMCGHWAAKSALRKVFGKVDLCVPSRGHDDVDTASARAAGRQSSTSVSHTPPHDARDRGRFRVAESWLSLAAFALGGLRVAPIDRTEGRVENGHADPSSARSLAALAAIGGATAATAVAGAIATQRRVRSPWYVGLRKPAFQPSRSAFAPVWTTLYALIAASAWRVWRTPASPERTRALGLWTAQLGLNGAWSWVFFGVRRPKLALAELAALFGAIAVYAAAARKVDRTAAWMVAPYLAWTGFAGALNEEIARRNP